MLKSADGKAFLGYEVDSMGPATPANAQRVGHSPVTANGANFSDMTVYRAASGATVFATGSINWSVSHPQAQQMTRNVLARFISNAFADTIPVRPALPAPFRAADIGNTGRAGFVSLSSANGFTLNGAGQNTQSSIHRCAVLRASASVRRRGNRGAGHRAAACLRVPRRAS